MTDKKLPPEALDVTMQRHGKTIREFLNDCVMEMFYSDYTMAIWEEHEEFSGNHDWSCEVMESLAETEYRNTIVIEKQEDGYTYYDYDYDTIAQLLKDHYLVKAVKSNEA